MGEGRGIYSVAMFQINRMVKLFLGLAMRFIFLPY